ncbi:MAG: peroxiredoxin [Candidatus Omnitrophica bacterium]|nr:MAG: Alkyl hydroperoxide reductase subunit C [Candidatus Hinthialibacteria bacterium OLB16]MBE7489911.1 peroxiredoxin [bacterium]MCC6733682.1 peroxiredoxin [Candidatus Omnitrophota bacterium]MCE7907396.1 peroxiredoxin [Candidatus Omnitrophica bacterium COP1]MBV6481434.1 Alkyl hydroperoxide reductase C [bacterium]
MLQVGKPAPSFKAQALAGTEFKEIGLDDYKGKWVCLYFYPLDFTFVCPTEIVEFNNAVDRFKALNCEVIGGSTDSVFSHLGWTQADERISNLSYPLISDITQAIGREYGILIEEKGITLRGAFLIDPNGILRYQLVHDLSVGRNVDEILRVLTALQTGELCPATWKKKGDKTLGKG